MYKGIISFINGVDKFGAKPPVGFENRFAVLTWFDKGPDYADPWPLVRHAIPKIASFVKADAVIAEYYEFRKSGFLLLKNKKILKRTIPWEELMKNDDDSLHEEEFPHGLRFVKEGITLLIEESEMWNQVGGPPPYHDSLTLSFFSTKPIFSELRAIFCDASVTIGVKIEET